MKLNINLPTGDDLVGGLELEAVHPPLVSARESLEAAEAKLEGVREKLRTATERADAAPALVRSGSATAADLREVLDQQRAASLTVAGAEEAVEEHQKAVEQERAAAVVALQDEVRRRAEQLQAVAGELAPVLEQLRGAEMALRQAAQRAVAGERGDLNMPVKVAVPALRWPSSIGAQAAALPRASTKAHGWHAGPDGRRRWGPPETEAKAS